MDRISNQLVEVQFDAKSVSWRPTLEKHLDGSPDTTREKPLSSSEVLRALMGLTDALPAHWASAVDDAIAAGALAKATPDADGWQTIAKSKG